MTPEIFLTNVLDPGLTFVAELGGPQPTDDVRRFLLCIALQESGPMLAARYQNSPSTSAGPARGFWQFERGGGVAGVLNHAASKALAAQACQALTVAANPAAVWRALEGHDLLAVAFARLLVFTDPHPVPVTEQAAWTCYCNRLWRPGKPHPETWPTNWRTASGAVTPPAREV
jgi:hypothetical protein